MNGKISKTMAVAITAMFCVAAFAAILPTDDSSADSVNYNFYVQIVDKDKNFISKEWYTVSEPSVSMDSCIDAAKTFAKHGINASLSTSGWWTGPTINGTVYYASILYASGNDWKVISDYPKDYGENTTFAVTFYASTNMDPDTFAAEPVTKTLEKYNELSADEKKNYVTDDYYAYLLPGVSTTDYNEPASNDNTTTIIIVAVVVIVVIIAIVAVVLIKKKG